MLPENETPKRQRTDVIPTVSGGNFVIRNEDQFSESSRHSVQARRRVPRDIVMECPAHLLSTVMTKKTKGRNRARLMLGELVGGQEDSAR